MWDRTGFLASASRAAIVRPQRRWGRGHEAHSVVGLRLLAPAVLIGLELFHPSNFTAHPGMYQYLSQAEPHSAAHHHALDCFGPRWWLVLHMIQTPSSAPFAASAFIAAALLLSRRAGWANMAVLVAFGWEL